jgi:hypothetical protein
VLSVAAVSESCHPGEIDLADRGASWMTCRAAAIAGGRDYVDIGIRGLPMHLVAHLVCIWSCIWLHLIRPDLAALSLEFGCPES